MYNKYFNWKQLWYHSLFIKNSRSIGWCVKLFFQMVHFLKLFIDNDHIATQFWKMDRRYFVYLILMHLQFHKLTSLLFHILHWIFTAFIKAIFSDFILKLGFLHSFYFILQLVFIIKFIPFLFISQFRIHPSH